jgi:hypothetical protein
MLENMTGTYLLFEENFICKGNFSRNPDKHMTNNPRIKEMNIGLTKITITLSISVIKYFC